MNEAQRSERRLDRLVMRLLGAANVVRLQECDRLKCRAENAAAMAGVCGLAMVNETTSAADVWLASHDRLATEYNALRFFWMPRMRLKLPHNTGIKPPPEGRSA